MAFLPTEAIAPTGAERVYFRQVFLWMGVGLAVTGVVGAAIGHSATAMNSLLQGSGQAIWIVCLVLELVLVFGLSTLVQHMNVTEAGTTFLAYAALNGLTISVIFAVYTTKSIYSTFFVTAGMFAAIALWGYTTNVDLTGWGSFLGMALVGLLIGLVVNLFWLNSTLYWVTTAVGVLLFSALTAYDVQKLKRYEVPDGSGTAAVEKSAIMGALALYLDFVNLFLYLLRIFGRRK
jgi:uncharacterized protein